MKTFSTANFSLAMKYGLRYVILCVFIKKVLIMIADYVFPGSILFLKFMFKLFVDQKPKLLDAYRAFLSFPIDITFLSLSFGVATLGHLEPSKNTTPNFKMVISFVIISIIIAFLSTKISNYANGVLDKSCYVKSFFVGALGYIISCFVIYRSLMIGS